MFVYLYWILFVSR